MSSDNLKTPIDALDWALRRITDRGEYWDRATEILNAAVEMKGRGVGLRSRALADEVLIALTAYGVDGIDPRALAEDWASRLLPKVHDTLNLFSMAYLPAAAPKAEAPVARAEGEAIDDEKLEAVEKVAQRLREHIKWMRDGMVRAGPKCINLYDMLVILPILEAFANPKVEPPASGLRAETDAGGEVS